MARKDVFMGGRYCSLGHKSIASGVHPLKSIPLSLSHSSFNSYECHLNLLKLVLILFGFPLLRSASSHVS